MHLRNILVALVAALLLALCFTSRAASQAGIPLSHPGSMATSPSKPPAAPAFHAVS